MNGQREDTLEERLGEAKIKVLEEKRYLLCKYLNAERHIIFLRTVCVLSKEDCEDIRSQKTQESKTNTFVDILLTKGPTAFDALCSSLLKDKTQVDVLLSPLNISFEQKRVEILNGQNMNL